jgi:hypothetical protein
MNAQQKLAWIRFGASASVFAYLCWKLFLIDSPSEVTARQEVRDYLSNMSYVFMFAIAVATFRPGKGVVEDERDRAISAFAAKSALMALTLIISFSLIIMDIETYAGRLTAAYPVVWFEHYLMACLAVAWVIESSICAFLYWRDRR